MDDSAPAFPTLGVDLHDAEKMLQRWFQDRWKNPPCSVCGVTDWNISGPASVNGYGWSAAETGRHYPVIPVACLNCGQTLLFNARIIGIPSHLLDEWEEFLHTRASQQAVGDDEPSEDEHE